MPEGRSKSSTVSVVWATLVNFSVRSKWFPVGRDWWPWTKPGYIITMTRTQSTSQWSGGIPAHPAPENSECKNPLEKFSPRFFGIKTASSSLIIFQRTKISMRSITHLCLCNWRTFEGKTPREDHQGCLVLARQCPAHRTLATQKKLAYLGFQCLNHPPYSPELAPSEYYLLPGLKNNWKFAILRPTRRSLLARRPVWIDKFLIFLSGLRKLEQGARKCIELRWDYVE